MNVGGLSVSLNRNQGGWRKRSLPGQRGTVFSGGGALSGSDSLSLSLFSDKLEDYVFSIHSYDTTNRYVNVIKRIMRFFKISSYKILIESN